MPEHEPMAPAGDDDGTLPGTGSTVVVLGACTYRGCHHAPPAPPAADAFLAGGCDDSGSPGRSMLRRPDQSSRLP